MASFFDDSDPDVIVRQIRNFVIRECDANDIHLKDIDIFLCPKWWNTVGGYITPTPSITIVRDKGDFTKPIAWSVDIKLNENLIGGFYVEKKQDK